MGMHMVESTGKKRWLSLAPGFCVAVIAFAIGLATHWASTFLPTESMMRQLSHEASDRSASTLKGRVREAKARGQNTLELNILACGWDIGSLREALSRDTVVVADLVEKRTYDDTYGLYTWYKFKTRETLVEHPRPRTFFEFESGPSDMLPIAEDEFLIREPNGQMVIDGVTVTQRSNGAKYLEGQTYLLLLWIEPSNRTAVRASTDPLGVFLLDSHGNLNSYIDRPYPLKTDLSKRFGNSIDNLRRALKK
jgi:hypothetical protein